MDPAHPFKLAPQLLTMELLLPLPLEGSESSIFLKTVAWYPLESVRVSGGFTQMAYSRKSSRKGEEGV